LASKSALSTQIPKKILVDLDGFCSRTGKKKTDVVAASVFNFLQLADDEQELQVRSYLDSLREN